MSVLRKLAAILFGSLFVLSTSASAVVTTAYPTRDAIHLKGVYHDQEQWTGLNSSIYPQIQGNGNGGSTVNFEWRAFTTNTRRTQAQCTAAGDEWFNSRSCFHANPNLDQLISNLSPYMPLSGIVTGVPTFAQTPNCTDGRCGIKTGTGGAENDYADFYKWLAKRYNGDTAAGSPGRIVDFIVGNEVNLWFFFDPGCVPPSGCTVNGTADLYATMWNLAYNAVISEQTNARVYVSLNNDFFPASQNLAQAMPVIAGVNFLSRFAQSAAGPWYVAIHPYSKITGAPAFSVADYQEYSPDPNYPGKLTFGNVGAVVGWLWKNYPNGDAKNKVLLSEVGFSSDNLYDASSNPIFSSSEAIQTDSVCRAYSNALGTPGILNFNYHRLIDNPAEANLKLGLWKSDNPSTAYQKGAWPVWALMTNSSYFNSIGYDSCGFKNLPNVKITRSYSAGDGHWASSRFAPPGYSAEATYWMVRDPSASDLPYMRPIFECGISNSTNLMKHNMLSIYSSCEGGFLPLGPVGYVWTSAGTGRQALYRCSIAAGADHFVSTSSTCEGQTVDYLLGYAPT